MDTIFLIKKVKCKHLTYKKCSKPLAFSDTYYVCIVKPVCTYPARPSLFNNIQINPLYLILV